MSVILSVTKEKARERMATMVPGERSERTGRSFAQAWKETQKSGIGRLFKTSQTDLRKSFTLPRLM